LPPSLSREEAAERLTNNKKRKKKKEKKEKKEKEKLSH
jgi:hypothetical protein